MNERGSRGFEDSHSDESFESLVDLFSLITIALILAAVVYGFKNNLVLETIRTPIKEIVESAGSSDVSLDNAFIIYIVNDGGQDEVIFNDTDRGRRVVPVSRQNIAEVLDGEYSYLINAREIALIVDISGTDTTQAIFADVQRWMAEKEMGERVSVGFSR